MPFPPAAVNQKAKKGLCENGKGIVLPFSKTQPVFCFLCAAGLRRLPCGKKWAFVSFGLQKKEILLSCGWCYPPTTYDDLPAHSRGGLFTFSLMKK